MDTLETASVGTVLGFVLVAAGELLTLATVSTFGVALVGLCLLVSLFAMTWRLVRATGRHVGTRNHFVNIDGVLHPRR